jgi:hypothetical protein
MGFRFPTGTLCWVASDYRNAKMDNPHSFPHKNTTFPTGFPQPKKKKVLTNKKRAFQNPPLFVKIWLSQFVFSIFVLIHTLPHLEQAHLY